MEYIYFENEIAKKTQYDGYYATKSGKIISIKVKGGQGKLDFDNPREHNYKIDKDGYLETCISIVENGIHKRIAKRTHRLIWETFYGNIPNDLTIDHIDNNPKNNSLDNLRLLTREENTSIANKNKKSKKRYFYYLYKNSKFIGKFDRKELFQLLGLTKKDFYRNTKRNQKLYIQGYIWIKESVEDIEKIL